VALIAVVTWALLSAGRAIMNGHPSYWAFYLGTALLGVAAVLVGVARRARRTMAWAAVLATIGLVAVAALAWWLIPFEATGRALVALESDDAVVVTSSASAITMTPAGPADVGIIFQPGARVDARAYGRILRPVAEAGYQVVIVKQPLGVAFLASGFAPAWAADHPEVGRWVVAGHSLGGVVAAENAAAPNAIDDLVLWASFPASDMSSEPFEAVSVFGTDDALTTTADIEASIDDLPDGTTFVAVDGAVHGHFGDYGIQPGDGEPGISRAEAQEQIVQATLAFLRP
jgi:hypothetical protein